MGPSQNLKQFPLLVVILLNFFTIFGSSGYTDLVYKGCADQKFQDPDGIYSQSLNNLFETLKSQSSSSKFYNTTSGQGLSAITGAFQCRGDLSSSDCQNCIKKIPSMSQKLCGEAVAARVQLEGCYLRYEVVGFREAGATDLLFKICGSTQVSGSGFGDKLEPALGEIAKGVNGGNGFYVGVYQSVYVLGQCEGDLIGGDCVNCVKNAAQKAKSECGASISAQIYLQLCYITYSYYPNGVPSKSMSSSSSGTGRDTQKMVAIVLGGLVGVGLVAACLLFTRSAYKKQSRAKYGGY